MQNLTGNDPNPICCDLCPRACGVDRQAGKRGVCGANNDVVVARASLHQWEEPPISGTYGSGTVFFSHCSLQCCYCQNRAISSRNSGHSKNIDELAAICCSLQQSKATNINFVTPTHYAPHIRCAIDAAKKKDLSLPVVWNTSGYETVQAIRDNEGYVDIYLSDFKYADKELANDLSGVSNYPEIALRAIEEMVSSVGAAQYDRFYDNRRMLKGVIVRHLLLPGHLDDSKRAIALLHERFQNEITFSLMNQYTPVITQAAASGDKCAKECLKRHPELARKVNESEYEELLDYADSLGIEDYFWQDGDAASESFIPDFDL